MTYFIYLLLFATLLFTLTSYVYLMHTRKKEFKFILNENEESFTNNFVGAKDSFSIGNQRHFIKKKEQIKHTDLELRLKLKKFNQQLNRSLKTLVYISMIETNSEMKKNVDQLMEILNLKENVQREVLRITEKINHYKSLQIRSRHV